MSNVMTDEALLDWLDWHVTCCHLGCEQAADWWLVCSACEAHAPWCEPHRRREVLQVHSRNPFSRATCARCLETVRCGQWGQLFRFVPIDCVGLA